MSIKKSRYIINTIAEDVVYNTILLENHLVVASSLEKLFGLSHGTIVEYNIKERPMGSYKVRFGPKAS
ncbi:hypothetical protein [Halobacillus litoralis]|uniref:hypothetical protein n=1 Tax=Halobacillus litoralis TaxID=45668 RepID=UPI001CFF2843|nr:hypothetical protein [Halobacillus litoralis]